MFTDFVITFRETLEAALVVGIVLSCLVRMGNKSWFSVVYSSIISAIVASVVVGLAFEWFWGGFEGVQEEIFEGVIMLVAAALMSWMIVWMICQRHRIKAHLQQRVDAHVQQESKAGVFLLVFVAVLREGIETVLFLKASAFQSGGNSLWASLFGILLAVLLGYLLFSGLRKVSLKHFFGVTSLLLVLFAAGLVAHGVHELEEAGIITVWNSQIWDVNPHVVVEGAYPLLHEKGTIGGLFKGVFGWNGNPSLIEVMSYLLYLVIMGLVYRKVEGGSSKAVENFPQDS